MAKFQKPSKLTMEEAWVSVKVKALKQRYANYLRTYGITFAQYNEMFQAQGGVCAICKSSPKPGHLLDVDHDHLTNKLRGLLCRSCNLRLAGVDRLEWLEEALEYILKYV